MYSSHSMNATSLSASGWSSTPLDARSLAKLGNSACRETLKNDSNDSSLMASVSIPAVSGGAAGAVAVFPPSEFSFSRKFLRGLHTTKAKMIGAGVDFAFAARANDVA